MRMNSTKSINDRDTQIKYTIYIHHYNSALHLMRYFRSIARENERNMEDLNFTASVKAGYDGDQDIEFEIVIHRPSTPEEREEYLARKAQEKAAGKEAARKEIKRLQKLLEQE